MCHYLGGGLHGKQKRVKAQSESSKSVVNSVLISREMPVFPGFLEIIRVVMTNIMIPATHKKQPNSHIITSSIFLMGYIPFHSNTLIGFISNLPSSICLI